MSHLLLPIDRHRLGLRLGQLLAGLCLYGFGIALMVQATWGVAPWDVLSLGLVRVTTLGFGSATIVVSLVVLVLWLPLKQAYGLGTLLNALLVGPFADLGLWLFPQPESLWLRIPQFALGLVVLAFATGMYIGAGLGPGPRDGLMTGLVRATGKPIWMIRTLLEGSVVVMGFLLGGPVGLGTLAFAAGVGPLVQFFLPWFERRRSRMMARTVVVEPVA